MVAFRSIGVLAAAFVGFGVTIAQAPADLRSEVQRALAAARPALLEHVALVDRGGVRPGELALLVLAAIHDGVDPSDAVLASAIRRLVKANPEETYDLALRLLVLEALPALADRGAIARRDARELLSNRARDGGFTYASPMQRQDLSNTQYAALGLRAAVSLGVGVDRAVWSKMAATIGEAQSPGGGFEYGRGHVRGADGGYASMTAAGIAVLAICRQQLGDGPHRERLDRCIQDGWTWFERHPQTIGAADQHWSFYFHYGLERAAILCDVVTIGNVDWYETGARMLVGSQLAGGGWRSETDRYSGVEAANGRGDGVPTAFAILFLRRKFQKGPTPITPSTPTLAALGPHASAESVAACVSELTRRGKAALFETVRALRSDVVTRRRAAAAAFVAITGQSFAFDPELDEDANCDALRAIELWYLKNR